MLPARQPVGAALEVAQLRDLGGVLLGAGLQKAWSVSG